MGGLRLAASGSGGFNTSVIPPDADTFSSDDPSSEGFLGAVQRYTALILGMILTGLVMSLALGSTLSLRGVPSPLVSQAIAPMSAALTVIACLGVSFAIAVGVAKIVNPAVGTFVLGAGIGTLALGSGGYLDVLFAGGAGLSTGIETLIWGGMVLVMASGIYRLTGPLPDQPDQPVSDAICPRAVFSAPAVKASMAGLLALLAVLLFASNDLKGQALAAAVIAGSVTGHVGRVLAPSVQPILLYATPCVVLALGQMWAFQGDSDDVIRSWMQGGPRLGIPTPIDVAAGALMGVSMGIGFSRGVVEAHLKGG